MTDDALTADQLQELIGADAARWPALGLTTTTGNPANPDATDQVTVRRDGEIIGYTEWSPRFPGLRDYRAIITGEHGVAFPAGFMPLDPVRAQRGEQRRWLPVGHADRPTD